MVSSHNVRDCGRRVQTKHAEKAHTSKGSPVLMVLCVKMHSVKILETPHSRCSLSQNCTELHPLHVSQIAQTAEAYNAHAYGAASVSPAANTAAAASATDAAVLRHFISSTMCR